MKTVTQPSSVYSSRLSPGFYTVGHHVFCRGVDFLCQVAEELALEGAPVLYLSAQNKGFSLFSKSLSRTFSRHHQQDRNHPKATSLSLLETPYAYPEAFCQLANDQMNLLRTNLCIQYLPPFGSISDVEALVEVYIAREKTTPVVILDWLGFYYLGATKKGFFPEEVDREAVVKTLKDIQVRHNLIFFTSLPFQYDEKHLPMGEDWLRRYEGLSDATDHFWVLEPWGLFEDGLCDDKEETRVQRNQRLMAMGKEEVQSVALKCVRTANADFGTIRLLYDSQAGFYSLWDRSFSH